MENKKNQKVKKHKKIVLYQNIGGHKGSTKFSVRIKRVWGIPPQKYRLKPLRRIIESLSFLNRLPTYLATYLR